jgi:hypothetical protein
LLIETREQFEATNPGKIQNGRRVRDDDQRRPVSSSVRRSSWNSSTP